MCLSDYGDYPEFYSSTEHRARKAHQCCECCRQIEPGERYLRVTGKWDGLLDSFPTCAHCQVLLAWLQAECGNVLHGGLYEDFADHAQEYRRLDLWRLTLGQRNKWRFRRGPNAGRLRPVPAPPPTSKQSNTVAA